METREEILGFLKRLYELDKQAYLYATGTAIDWLTRSQAKVGDDMFHGSPMTSTSFGDIGRLYGSLETLRNLIITLEENVK